MRRFRPILCFLAALAVPWLARPADACPYSYSYAYSAPYAYSQSYYAPSYPAVKQQVVIAPVAIYLPLYGAGYVAPAAPAPAPQAAPAKSPCDEKIERLEREMRRMQERYERPPPERQPDYRPQPPPEPMRQPQGGEASEPAPTTSLSNLASVPVAKRWEIHGRVNAGQMPKRANPLPDTDAKEFLDWAGGKPASARLQQVVQESCVKCHR